MSNQTQCPHCQTTYPMPTTKLGDSDARAKCGKCQQVFFLNANLVNSSSAAQTKQPNPTPQATAHKTQTTTDPQEKITPKRTKRTKRTLTEDMIHDDMDGVEENKPKTVLGVSFDNDELENFLKDNINFAPTTAKSTKDELADDEGDDWAHDLLNDTKPVNTAQTSTTNTKAKTSPIENNTSPIENNVDLTTIIPVATPKPKKPIKKIWSKKPTSQQLATKKSLVSQLLWLLGCLLLIGLLVVQYALFNVDKLAKNPETANFIYTVCNIISCSVPSANLDALSITSSLKNQKDIIIDIANKTNSEQLFPYLLVQLKDSQGVVVADFVADTKDYLSQSQTTLLANQHKRIMLSVSENSAPKVSTVTVTPFYQ